MVYIRSAFVGLVAVSAAVSGNLVACVEFPLLVIALARNWTIANWAVIVVSLFSLLQTIYGITSLIANEFNEIVPTVSNTTSEEQRTNTLRWFSLAGLPLDKGLPAGVGATVAPSLVVLFALLFRPKISQAVAASTTQTALSTFLVMCCVVACFCAAFSAPSLVVNATFFLFAVVQSVQLSFNVSDAAFGLFNSLVVGFGTFVMLALCVFQNSFVRSKVDPPAFLGVPVWLTIDDVALLKNWAQAFAIIAVTLIAARIRASTLPPSAAASPSSKGNDGEETKSEPTHTSREETRDPESVGGRKTNKNKPKDGASSAAQNDIHTSGAVNASFYDDLDESIVIEPASPELGEKVKPVKHFVAGFEFIVSIISQGFALFKYLLFVLPTAPYTCVCLAVIYIPSAVSILGVPVTISGLLSSPRFVTFIMSSFLSLYTIAFCCQVAVGAMTTQDVTGTPSTVPGWLQKAFLFTTNAGNQQIEMLANGLNFMLLCFAVRERTLSIRSLVVEAPKPAFSPTQSYEILGPRRFEDISNFVDAVVRANSPSINSEPIRAYVLGQAAVFANSPFEALLMWARIVIANYNYFISVLLCFIAGTWVDQLDILHAGMIFVVLFFAAIPMQLSRRFWFVFVMYILGLTGAILVSGFAGRFDPFKPDDAIGGQSILTWKILGLSSSRDTGETVTALAALFVTSAQVFVNYNEQYRPNEFIVAETFMLYEWNRFSGHQMVRTWRTRLTLFAAGFVLVGVPLLSAPSLMAFVLLLLFYTVSVVSGYGLSTTVHLVMWRFTMVYTALILLFVTLYQFKPIYDEVDKSFDSSFPQCRNITNPTCLEQVGATRDKSTILATIIPWAIALVVSAAHSDEIRANIDASEKAAADKKAKEDAERGADEDDDDHDHHLHNDSREEDIAAKGNRSAGRTRRKSDIPPPQELESIHGKNSRGGSSAAFAPTKHSHYDSDDDDDEEEDEDDDEEDFFDDDDDEENDENFVANAHRDSADDLDRHRNNNNNNNNNYNNTQPHSAPLNRSPQLPRVGISPTPARKRMDGTDASPSAFRARRHPLNQKGSKIDEGKLVLGDPDVVGSRRKARDETRRKNVKRKKKSTSKRIRSIFSTQGKVARAHDMALESFPYVDQAALFFLTYILDLADRTLQILATLYKEYSRSLAMLALVLVFAFDPTLLGIIFGVFLLFGFTGKIPLIYCVIRSCIDYGYQFDFVPSDPVEVQGVSIIQLCGFGKSQSFTGSNITGRLVITAFFANLACDAMADYKSSYAKLSRFIQKLNRTIATEASYELTVLTLLITLSYSSHWLVGWVVTLFSIFVGVVLSRERLLPSFWWSVVIRVLFALIFLGAHLVGLLGQNRVVAVETWTKYFGFGFERSTIISMGVAIVGQFCIAANRDLFAKRIEALRIIRGYDSFAEWIANQAYSFDDANELMAFTRSTFDSLLPSFREKVFEASGNKSKANAKSNGAKRLARAVSSEFGGGQYKEAPEGAVVMDRGRQVLSKNTTRNANELMLLGNLDPVRRNNRSRNFAATRHNFATSAPLASAADRDDGNDDDDDDGSRDHNVTLRPRRADDEALTFTYTFDEFRIPTKNHMATYDDDDDDDDDGDNENGSSNQQRHRGGLSGTTNQQQQVVQYDGSIAIGVAEGDASEGNKVIDLVDTLKSDIIFLSERGSELFGFAMGRAALCGFVLLAFSLTGLSFLHIVFVWIGGFMISFNERANVTGHLHWFKATWATFLILPLFPLVANLPPVASWVVAYPRYSRVLALEHLQKPLEFGWSMVIVLFVVVLQKRFVDSFARAEYIREAYAAQFRRRRRHARLVAFSKARLRLQWTKIFNLERHSERMLAQIRNMAASGGLISAAAVVSSSSTSAPPGEASATAQAFASSAKEAIKNAEIRNKLSNMDEEDDGNRKYFVESYHPPLEDDAGFRDKMTKRIFDAADNWSEHCVKHCYRPAETGTELKQYSRWKRFFLAVFEWFQARTFDCCAIALFINALLSGTVVDCLLLFVWVVVGATVYPRPPLRWIEYGMIYILVAISLKLLIICITTLAAPSADAMRVLSAFFVEVSEESAQNGSFADLSDLVWDLVVFATFVLRKELTLHNGVFLAITEENQAAMKVEKKLRRRRLREEKETTERMMYIEQCKRDGKEPDPVVVNPRKQGGHDSSSSSASGSSGDDDEFYDRSTQNITNRANNNNSKSGSGSKDKQKQQQGGERDKKDNDNDNDDHDHDVDGGDNTGKIKPQTNKKSKDELSFAEQAAAFWLRYYACRKGIGKDSYLLSVCMLWFALLVFVFGFYQIAGGTGSLVTALQSDLLPGTLVVVIASMTLVIIADRAAYLLVNVYVKAAVHTLFSACGIFGYVIYRDIHRDSAFAGYLFFVCCWAYLIISAAQVKSGFPRQRRHDPFTPYPESDLRSTFYSIYMAIPFLWELRTCIDWTFTVTSLSFDEWFKVEDVIQMVYARRTNLHGRPPRLGEKQDVNAKLKGLLKVLFMVVVLLFPLMNFSTFNPNTTANAIVQMSIKIQFGQVSPIYDSATFTGTAVPGDYAQWLTRVYPGLASWDILGAHKSTQLIELTHCSSELWTISPQGLHSLNNSLDQVIAANATFPLQVTLQVTRKHTSGEAPLTITTPTTHDLDVEAAKKMKQALSSVAGDVSAPVAKLFTPIIFNQPTGLTPYENVQAGCYLTLRAPEYNPELSTNVRYWCVECPAIFTRGNVPNSSFPEYSCITTGSGCGGAFNFESSAYSIDTHQNTSLYTVYVSDDVASSFGFLAGIGIIAFYTTFVLAVGNALRGMFSSTAHYAVFTEMAHPLHVHTLLQYLELARFARPPDLQTENRVYLQLIDLLRSPETLLRFTGRMLKLYKSNNEVRSEEQFTAALPDDGQQPDSDDETNHASPDQLHANWDAEFNQPLRPVALVPGELPVRLVPVPHEEDPDKDLQQDHTA